jgi:Co/Zn/Cd efflux system component
MMDACCENKSSELTQLRERQAKVLYVVLAINGLMFLFEFIAGWVIGSTALLGDSLDMFGDTTVYALTLYTLHRSDRERAAASLVKGGFMLIFGIAVIGEAIYKSVAGAAPTAEAMGIVGVIALMANSICFLMLYRFRSDDINMRSTWLCSRNDLIANTGVIIAAVLVGATQTRWPDVVIGMIIAGLFLHSAWRVLGEASREWRGSDPRAIKAGDEGSESVEKHDTCQQSSCCR